MKILKQDCKKDDAQDKTLPYTCYLIIYNVDGVEKYDLAMGSKQVDLFDYYYDLYKENFNRIFNPTLTKNMPNVKWKEIPPVRGPNPQGVNNGNNKKNNK